MPQQQIDLYKCVDSVGGITTTQAARVRSTLGITDIIGDETLATGITGDTVSEQLSSLNDRVDAYAEDLATLDGDLAALDLRVDAYAEDLAILTDDLTAHINDPYAAHPASAISIDSAYASNVQEALDSISDQIGGTATSSCFVDDIDDTTFLYPSVSPSNLKICVDTGCSVIIAAGAADRCITLSGSSTINCLSTNLGCALCIDAACVKSTCFQSTCFDGRAACAVTVSDSAITEAKLGTSSVTTNKIANSAVNADKIADSAVTAVKIAGNAVITAKIADSNVTTAKIADSAVTAVKIADNAVTAAKLLAPTSVCSRAAISVTTGTPSSWVAVTDATRIITDTICRSGQTNIVSGAGAAGICFNAQIYCAPTTITVATLNVNDEVDQSHLALTFAVPKSWCYRICQTGASYCMQHCFVEVPIVG